MRRLKNTTFPNTLARLKRHTWSWVLLGIGGLFLAGCSEYQPHQVSRVGEPQETLVSNRPNHFEAVSGRFHVTLDVQNPPLQKGENETIILKLRNADTDAPISIHTLEVEAFQQERNEPPQEPINKAEWINAETEVAPLGEPGTYRVSANFPKAGKWHFQVRPNRIPQRERSRMIYFHLNVQDS